MIFMKQKQSQSQHQESAAISDTGIPGAPYAPLAYPRAPLVGRKEQECKPPATGLTFLVMLVMFAGGIAADRAWLVFHSPVTTEDQPEIEVAPLKQTVQSQLTATSSACLAGVQADRHLRLRTWAQDVSQAQVADLGQTELNRVTSLVQAWRAWPLAAPDKAKCLAGQECEWDAAGDVVSAVELEWLALNDFDQDNWQELPAGGLRERLKADFDLTQVNLSQYPDLVYDENLDTFLTLGPVLGVQGNPNITGRVHRLTDGNQLVWVGERDDNACRMTDYVLLQRDTHTHTLRVIGLKTIINHQ